MIECNLIKTVLLLHEIGLMHNWAREKKPSETKILVYVKYNIQMTSSA